MMAEPTPVDPKRCQTMKRSFMTLGPGLTQCTARPAFVGIEIDPPHGEMSLCVECRAVCEVKVQGVRFVTLASWKQRQRRSMSRV